MSGLPKKYPGVWQSLQPPNPTRYLPRLISALSAAAALGGTTSVNATAAAATPKPRATSARLRAAALCPATGRLARFAARALRTLPLDPAAISLLLPILISVSTRISR